MLPPVEVPLPPSDGVLVGVVVLAGFSVGSASSSGSLVGFSDALGFSVLIDDFGSGASSLSMLQTTDADVIKLDGRFMSVETSQAAKSENIIKSVNNMSWEIGMPVIVEGVETEKQVTFLRDLGTRYAQGFYYYRPMPVESFEELIAGTESIDPRGILLHGSGQYADTER